MITSSDSYTSFDVAFYLRVTHKEVLRKMDTLFKNNVLDAREIESIRPHNGERRRHGYRLSVIEFVFLIIRLNEKNISQLDDLWNLVLNDNEVKLISFMSLDLKIEKSDIGFSIAGGGGVKGVDSNISSQIPKEDMDALFD